MSEWEAASCTSLFCVYLFTASYVQQALHVYFFIPLDSNSEAALPINMLQCYVSMMVLCKITIK